MTPADRIAATLARSDFISTRRETRPMTDTSREAVERHLNLDHNHEAGLIPVASQDILRALLTRAETAEGLLAEATAQIHRLTAVGDGLSAFVCDEGDPEVKRWHKACDEAFRTIFRKDQGRPDQ